MLPWEVKIPTEDFTDETLTINDTYRDDVRESVVLVVEVDKVADEVTDREIDMQTDMVVNIINEEVIGVTLAIGGQIYNQRQWRHLMANFELNQVVPPGSQIQN